MSGSGEKQTMQELIVEYKNLLNTYLPGRYTYPVRFNHCFNRIVLDWLFDDCWYNHLDTKKTAVSQLSEQQLRSAVDRMNRWMEDQQLLIADNKRSLLFRKRQRLA